MKTKLPTFAAFRRMSLRRRTETFRDWAKSMPARGRYDTGDSTNCAICQFGQALGVSSVEAEASKLWVGEDQISVLPKPTRADMNSTTTIYAFTSMWTDNPCPTFGALARALDKHLA